MRRYSRVTVLEGVFGKTSPPPEKEVERSIVGIVETTKQGFLEVKSSFGRRTESWYLSG